MKKWIYSGTREEQPSERELMHGKLARKAASEGIVLLKNEGILPLKKDTAAALLGYGAEKTVKGGIGSGDVNNRKNTSIYQGLKEAGVKIVSEDWISDYHNRYEQAREAWKEKVLEEAKKVDNPFDAYASNPFIMPEGRPVSEMDIQEAEIVVYVISRISGEGKDRRLEKGDYYLSEREEKDILFLNSRSVPIVLLINAGGPVELTDILEKAQWIKGILNISQLGQEGGRAVARILLGEAVPSGKLTTTWAKKYADVPFAENFSYLNGNLETEEYTEGIYVGYRYFDSFGIQPLFPFGYGLSYTTFEQTLKSVDVDLENRTVTAEVDVKNTGDVAGKDVVQLYTSVPYTDYDVENKVEKSAVQLLDYEKTDMIEPGESQTVTITADAQDMASWDSTCSNEAGTTGNWILDNGTYYFTVGNGAHEAVNNILAAQDQIVEGNKDNVQTWELGDFDSSSFAVTLNGTPVENQLQDADLNNWMEDTVTYLSRNDWEGTWPETYKDLTATDEMISTMADDYSDIEANGDPSSVTFGADNGMTLANMKGVEDITDERWSTLMDQLTLEECLIRTGLGGTSTKVIESITSPEAIQNDGPNGFNSYPLGQYANSDASTGDPCVIAEDDPNRDYKMGVMANETVIGQTFSKQLAAEWGKAVGNYSLWANTAIWWGVGTNLHRTPYNARNHEYFSEDAVLTAGQGAAIIKAGHEYGVLIAPKHLAFNDTEINRTGIAEFMTEQAARENELRGTQSCIEDANALAVMTTYNRVGCVTSNAHTGLLLNILHKEWGFKGLMSEDFIQDPAYTKIRMAVHNGVTMTCNTGDNTMAAVEAVWPYWSVENASQSEELLTDLKQAMLYQNYALANSNAMDGMSTSTHIEKLNTWYDNLITGLRIGFGVLTVLCAAMYLLGLKKKEQ